MGCRVGDILLSDRIRKNVPRHTVWVSYLNIWRASVESSNDKHNVCTWKQINKSEFLMPILAAILKLKAYC